MTYYDHAVSAHHLDGIILVCPLFFQQHLLTNECHGYDQVNILIHELTHVEPILGSVDFAYGYVNSTRLTGEETLVNADNYALFANGKSYQVLQSEGTCADVKQEAAWLNSRRPGSC